MQPEIIKLIKKYACHSEAKENSTGNNAYILSYKKRFSVHIVLEKKKTKQQTITIWMIKTLWMYVIFAKLFLFPKVKYTTLTYYRYNL